MKGRRRADVTFGDLPPNPQPGDYWKYVSRETGEPMRSPHPQNLTGTVWGIVPPETGFGAATLSLHTVREHDDGTISVLPGDGSSNSIDVTGAHGKHWHGYLREGTWESL